MFGQCGNLHVAFDRVIPRGADVEFRAERLSQPSGDFWILYLSTDQPSVHLTRVTPEMLGHTLDDDGTLGLIFGSDVRRVQIAVRTSSAQRAQGLRFWLNEEASCDRRLAVSDWIERHR